MDTGLRKSNENLENHLSIRINLILLESRIIALHLRRWTTLIVWVYLHSNFHGGLRKTHVWVSVRNYGPWRSSKVVDFGINRKRVREFLLVINSNLGLILPRFRDIAGFLMRTTPHLFHPNFRGITLGLDCPVVAPRSEDPKLIICVITFELVQHMRPRYHVTDRRTDLQ